MQLQESKQVKAAQLMQTDVVELKADDRVEEAVSTLEQHRISGAPVVDAMGKLVGFLSVRDIAREEHTRGGRLKTERGEYEYAGPFDELQDGEEWEKEVLFGRDDYSPEILGAELVKDWMNPEVISVAPTVGLKQICRVMTRGAIHRVLVVENDKLRGIVSTTDVVRYLAEHL